MTHQPAPPDQARFYERRRGSFVFWTFATGLPILFGFQIVRSAIDGVDRWFFAASAAVVVFYGFFLWYTLGRWGTEFKHLTVDDTGLWIRAFRHLPAERMGHIRVLAEREALKLASTTRIDGLSALRGIGSYSPVASHGRAVLIHEHLPDGRTRPWGVATHRPDELVAALEQVRDAARPGPAADPGTARDDSRP